MIDGTWPRRRRKDKAKRTHCIWGHPIIPENRYTNATTGQSSCRVCMEARRAKAKAKLERAHQ